MLIIVFVIVEVVISIGYCICLSRGCFTIVGVDQEIVILLYVSF